MYGLMNRSIQDLVVFRHGKAAWTAVLEAAGIPHTEFQSMEQYPDQMTYALIGAAAQTLKLSADHVAEMVGEHWILYTAKVGYGDLLRIAGDDFVSLLQNLDLLHARIGRAYPSLLPPAFQCTDITESSLRLHYRSPRPGLTPLVIGLIRGLAKMFKTTAEVTLLEAKAAGADHDIFLITHTSSGH